MIILIKHKIFHFKICIFAKFLRKIIRQKF